MTRIEEIIADSVAIDVNSALTTFVSQCRADWGVEIDDEELQLRVIVVNVACDALPERMSGREIIALFPRVDKVLRVLDGSWFTVHDAIVEAQSAWAEGEGQ